MGAWRAAHPGRGVTGLPGERGFTRRAKSSAALLAGCRVPDRSVLRVEDRDLGRSEGQGGRLPHEFSRRRDAEVGFERLGIFPALDEHHPELILDVTVDAVKQASRLPARTLNV